jgi:hypothetical protein
MATYSHSSVLYDAVARIPEVIRGNHTTHSKHAWLLVKLKLITVQANTTVATFIEEPLRVNHEMLGKLQFLESRFLPVSAIIANCVDVLAELKGLLKILTATRSISSEDKKIAERDIENRRKACAVFTRTAQFLQRRSESTGQLLANTLAFKNQVVAQEQNHAMLRLTKSTVFFTILTVFYLPWSFASVWISFISKVVRS